MTRASQVFPWRAVEISQTLPKVKLGQMHIRLVARQKCVVKMYHNKMRVSVFFLYFRIFYHLPSRPSGTMMISMMWLLWPGWTWMRKVPEYSPPTLTSWERRSAHVKTRPFFIRGCYTDEFKKQVNPDHSLQKWHIKTCQMYLPPSWFLVFAYFTHLNISNKFKY